MSGKSREDFLNSIQLQWAAIRGLEIIGEATKNLPEKFRKKYPQISWRQLAGMRDKLIHGYFRVDLELVWKVIQRDIPDLRKELSKIREQLNND